MKYFETTKEVKEIKKAYGFGSLLGWSNAKTIKGEKKGIRTHIMYLIPYKGYNGKNNLCPQATKGCAEACLVTAGRGKFNSVHEARNNRTGLYLKDRQTFLRVLAFEIQKAILSSEKKGLQPVFRLNGTSDIQFEEKQWWLDGKSIFQHFPNVTFYDYTKIYTRFNKILPANYSLTYSYNEKHGMKVANKVLASGGNVAMVFKNGLPEVISGYEVINGDETDLRFKDKKNVIVGLTAKGEAKKDVSGFVLDARNFKETKECLAKKVKLTVAA